MSSGEQQMIRLQKEVAELRSAVDVKAKELEVKVRYGVVISADRRNKKQKFDWS